MLWPAVLEVPDLLAPSAVSSSDPIVIGYDLVMPRRAADIQSEERVQRMVHRLFDGLGHDGETVADVARRAELPHETVRRLLRNPGGRSRSGPGFFIVAAIARARGISLDAIAEIDQ